MTQEELKQRFSESIFGQITEAADTLGMECYVVGDYVRDIFLQRPSKDMGVVVVGSGIAIVEVLGKQLEHGAHASVFRNFGTTQVKYGGTEVEFVGARKKSYQRDSCRPIVEDGTLEGDQNHRDLTIDALAVCLNKARLGELVDPFGGLEDMKEKTIRTPPDPDIAFSDDPLHMMRCTYFATQLGFYIDDNTFGSLCQNKERIEIISRERITNELNRIVPSSIPSKRFINLEHSDLLPLIFPEFIALQGMETRNGYSRKDSFYHTLEVLDSISRKTDNPWLRWAASLHDIAEPTTKRQEPKTGWAFHNHNSIGEKVIPHIFRKMKLPMNEKVKYVQGLASLYMRPIIIADDAVTDSTVCRLLFEAGDDVDDLMMLCEVDITLRDMERKQHFLNSLQLVRQKLKDLEGRGRVHNFQPPASREEIMEILGLEPYREVEVLKSAIGDAILDGVTPGEYEAARAFILERAKKVEMAPIR